MPARDTARPMTSVLSEIVSEVAYLLQTEIRLARTELGEKLGYAANGGAMIGAAAVLLLPGLFLLLLSAVRWLQVAGLPDQWGFLLVGGLAVLIGIGLFFAGARRMKGSALVPRRTIDQLRADYATAKEHTK
jgi:uncharacterized membrane protein YqjE